MLTWTGCFQIIYLRFQWHSIIEITKEEHVMELVGEVKLREVSLFEGRHAFQYVVIILITSERKRVVKLIKPSGCTIHTTVLFPCNWKW